MINCNKYVDILGDRFKHGFSSVLLSFACNRFLNGAIKVDVTFGGIISSGTGHWPFYMFQFLGVTGELASYQMTILGVTFGSRKVANLYEDGTIAGPDKRRHYIFFSGLNHQNKTLSEILNPQLTGD